MVTPVIRQGQIKVDVYFPKQAKWFDFYNGKEIDAQVTSLNAPIDFIPLHIRGGYIIPTQQPGMNTDESRKNPFELVIGKC